MPKLRAEVSAKRLADLAEAGMEVFCRQGYERSQVADVARAMGVAVGTVYLYVESKEALFDLVVRHASAPDAGWLADLEIPVRTPEPGSTVGFLQGIFESTGWPLLDAALGREEVDDVAAELEAILLEQYHLIHQHRRGLLLLMRSALEFPGLAEVFVLGLRNKLVEQLSAYVSQRAARGLLAPVEDVRATCAVLVQAISWANLQRPYDPGLAMLGEEAVERATIALLVRGLLP